MPNLGKHLSEEHKRKLSIALKGKNTWSKGIKFTEEAKKKIREHSARFWLGKHLSKETRKKISEARLGKSTGLFEEKATYWKGNKIKYSGLHKWVYRKLGKPNKCVHCGKEELNSKRINWANIDHKYCRVVEDWIRLCTKCHKKYDKVNNLTNHKRFYEHGCN